jgi:signal transduction histidine kinase
MNLKIRFALLFTSYVAVILIASSATIYVLYYNFRLQDFFRRVKNEGYSFYALYQESIQRGDTVKPFTKQNKYALVEENVILFDSLQHPILIEPDTLHYQVPTTFFEKAKAGEYRFREGIKECVGIYMSNTGTYVLSSGVDKYGLRKLHNIKLILLGVTLGGILLAVLLSIIFVNQALKPLKRLSEQMQQTKELTNAQKVEEGKGNDEIKQIASSYNAMIERLKKAFDSQKSFVNHASHELRTPLAIMLSQTEAAVNKKLDEAGYRKVLESLMEDQQEMIELTNNLLLLSQYEKVTHSQEWSQIRIDELLYESIKTAKKLFSNAHITLEFENITNEEHLLVKGNDTLLRSALRNLLKNAYLYSSDKSVSIKLNTDTKAITIAIQNVGSLVPADERDQLFIPFFRGNNSMDQKGHGLGLAIVQRIIDVHKGEITYEAIGTNINQFSIKLYL